MRRQLEILACAILMLLISACQAHPLLRGSVGDLERKFDQIVPIGTSYEEVRSRLAQAGVESDFGLIAAAPPSIFPGVADGAVVYYFGTISLGSYRPAPFFLFRNAVSMGLYFDRDRRLIGRQAEVAVDGL